jgi:hypothetical protein
MLGYEHAVYDSVGIAATAERPLPVRLVKLVGWITSTGSHSI